MESLEIKEFRLCNSKVFLEFCQNCEKHAWCTRHRVYYHCTYPGCGTKYESRKAWYRHSRRHADSSEPPKVLTKYDALKEKLLYQLKAATNAKFELVLNQNKASPSRIGSFEVSSTHENGRKSQYQYSKLKSGRWPCIATLVKEMIETMRNEHIKVLSSTLPAGKYDLKRLSSIYVHAVRDNNQNQNYSPGAVTKRRETVSRETLVSAFEESRCSDIANILSLCELDTLHWEQFLVLLHRHDKTRSKSSAICVETKESCINDATPFEHSKCKAKEYMLKKQSHNPVPTMTAIPSHDAEQQSLSMLKHEQNQRNSHYEDNEKTAETIPGNNVVNEDTMISAEEGKYENSQLKVLNNEVDRLQNNETVNYVSKFNEHLFDTQENKIDAETEKEEVKNKEAESPALSNFEINDFTIEGPSPRKDFQGDVQSDTITNSIEIRNEQITNIELDYTESNPVEYDKSEYEDNDFDEEEEETLDEVEEAKEDKDKYSDFDNEDEYKEESDDYKEEFEDEYGSESSSISSIEEYNDAQEINSEPEYDTEDFC